MNVRVCVPSDFKLWNLRDTDRQLTVCQNSKWICSPYSQNMHREHSFFPEVPHPIGLENTPQMEVVIEHTFSGRLFLTLKLVVVI